MKVYKDFSGKLYEEISRWLNVTTIIVTKRSRFYTEQNRGIVDGFYFKKTFYSLDDVLRVTEFKLFNLDDSVPEISINGYIPMINFCNFLVCVHPSCEKVKLVVKK